MNFLKIPHMLTPPHTHTYTHTYILSSIFISVASVHLKNQFTLIPPTPVQHHRTYFIIPLLPFHKCFSYSEKPDSLAAVGLLLHMYRSFKIVNTCPCEKHLSSRIQGLYTLLFILTVSKQNTVSRSQLSWALSSISLSLCFVYRLFHTQSFITIHSPLQGS